MSGKMDYRKKSNYKPKIKTKGLGKAIGMGERGCMFCKEPIYWTKGNAGKWTPVNIKGEPHRCKGLLQCSR